MRLLLTLAVSLMFCHWGRSQTVVLHLKNGDRLSGIVVTQQVNAVIMETPFGVITVPVDLITNREAASVPAASPVVQEPVESNASAPAVPPGLSRQELTNRLQTLSQQYLSGTVAPAEYHWKRSRLLEQLQMTDPGPPQLVGEPKAPPAPKSAGPPAVPAKKPSGKMVRKSEWKGEAQVGSDLGYGTKDRQLLSARLKINYAKNRFHNVLDYMFMYGRTDGELSADRMNGSLKTDWDATERMYLYNLMGMGYDEIRKIDFRYELGPGVGYHFIKTKALAANGEFGVNYQAEERNNSPQTDRFYYRLAESATLVLNSKLSLDEKFEWFPQVENLRNYRFRFEANARYLLAENLSLIMTVLDIYDTDPASNVDKNDLQIRSSLGLKF